MSTATLTPTSDVAITGSSYAIVGGATAAAVLAVNDGDTTRLQFGSGGTVECRMSAHPKALAINFISLVYVEQFGGALGVQTTRIGIKLNGTTYWSSWHTPTVGSYGTHTVTHTVNPQSGAAWTAAAINECTMLLEYYEPAGESESFTYLAISSSYEPVPASTDASRDVATRRIMHRQRNARVAQISGPLRLLDLAPGDRIAIEHYSEEGWDADSWSRRLHAIESISPNGHQVDITARDRRLLDRLLWSTEYSTKGTTPARDGVGRTGRGNTWTFTRSGAGYALARSGVILRGETDVEVYGPNGGLVIQGSAAHKLLNNAFALGISTSWTATGTGSNGSAIAADTSDLYVEKSLSMQSLKITGGNPVHAADLYHRAAAFACSANDKLNLHIAHKDDSGAALSWRAQRSVDSWYWNEGSRAWQAGNVWNALTVRSVPTVDLIRPFSVGGSGTNVTVDIGVPIATAVAGQINHAYLVDPEIGTHPGSPHITTTATETRAADRMLISNNTGQRIVNVAQGGLSIRAVPYWSSSEIGSVDKTVLYLIFDASNYLWWRYDGTNARWALTIRVGGVSYTATLTQSVTQGVELLLRARWTGSHGEHALAPYTLNLAVNGTLGTAATATGPMTEASPVNLEAGSKASADHFGGELFDLQSVAWVPTDIEMGRHWNG